LLEVKQQQIGNEIAMKMDFDAFWITRPQMEGIEGSLYATKKQLDIPSLIPL
jgi:hypothetical protein